MVQLIDGEAKPLERPEAMPLGEADVSVPELSFAALEARIHAMPEGPAGRLDHPRWAQFCGWLTMLFIAVGLTPILLVQWLTPQQWMVDMARVGVWCAYVFCAPFAARVLWVIGTGMMHWRRELVMQSDHDRAAFGDLRRWLVEFPRDQLVDHHAFAKIGAERLTAKLPLIVGSVERLGALPLLVALFLLMRSSKELSIASLTAIPGWHAIVGLGLVLAYAIGVHAVRMRLRLELYQTVLADALARTDRR